MNRVYAPGCALMLYKPESGKKVLEALEKEIDIVGDHHICCRHDHGLEMNTEIINTCSGCDRRFRELYKDITTISLWEILAKSKIFEFPNYNGIEMTIHDACPTRGRDSVHIAIRSLLEKMNIKIVEPQNTRQNAVCCGDSFYGVLPVQQVKEMMKKRADEMPCEEVIVYCVSCIKAMHIGGKKPRYLVDLLFGEETKIGTFDPDVWHAALQQYIDKH